MDGKKYKYLHVKPETKNLLYVIQAKMRLKYGKEPTFDEIIKEALYLYAEKYGLIKQDDVTKEDINVV